MELTRPHALAATIAWTILAATVSLAAPAQAQTYDPDYPVCLQVYDDMVHFYFECRYTSIAQCAASASGRAAECVVNPYYAGPPSKPGPRRKRSRKH
jgi:Protein of unknown function (DUF3551)